MTLLEHMRAYLSYRMFMYILYLLYDNIFSSYFSGVQKFFHWFSLSLDSQKIVLMNSEGGGIEVHCYWMTIRCLISVVGGLSQQCATSCQMLISLN